MIEHQELILRLALGAIYGGVIGFERQIHGRPAGFRTNILVCMASVLLMEVSEYYQHMSPNDPSYVRVDPGRIAAGAITGIGFIGAGVIIKMGANVLGLTTAASLWMVASIGLAVGGGLYVPSFVAFAFTLFSLLALRMVERHTPSLVFKTLEIHADCGVDEDMIAEIMKKHGASRYKTDYEVDNDTCRITIRYTVSIKRRVLDHSPMRPLVTDLSAIAHVRRINLRA